MVLLRAEEGWRQLPPGWGRGNFSPYKNVFIFNIFFPSCIPIYEKLKKLFCTRAVWFVPNGCLVCEAPCSWWHLPQCGISPVYCTEISQLHLSIPLFPLYSSGLLSSTSFISYFNLITSSEIYISALYFSVLVSKLSFKDVYYMNFHCNETVILAGTETRDRNSGWQWDKRQ
jgi:hypothetical protein